VCRHAKDMREIDDPVEPDAVVPHDVAEGGALKPRHELHDAQRTLSANSGYTL
jgi:hypothetical protein